MADEGHRMRDLNPPQGVALKGWNPLRGEYLCPPSALPGSSTSCSAHSRSLQQEGARGRSSSTSASSGRSSDSACVFHGQAKKQRVGPEIDSSPMDVSVEPDTVVSSAVSIPFSEAIGGQPHPLGLRPNKPPPHQEPLHFP